MRQRELGFTCLCLVLTLGAVSTATSARSTTRSPSARIVFVGFRHGSGGNDERLYTIRIDGTGLQRVGHASGWDPAVSPNRRQIAFTDGTGVGVVDVDGRHLRHLDGGPGDV